jgi:hypothetical protein
VPLTKIQTEVLRLLASHRDPESYVAGATPLNRAAIRYSSDIDVFHDREERVAAAAREDAETLAQSGYLVTWLRQLPLVYTAEVLRAEGGTRLEWVVDSDFRFFPTMTLRSAIFFTRWISPPIRSWLRPAAGKCVTWSI